MFDGRHCTKQDLILLDKETDKIVLLLDNNDLSIEVHLKIYLQFISRFDMDIACNISRRIKDKNNQEVKRIILDNIEVLRQNVIVDIYEHNK